MNPTPVIDTADWLLAVPVQTVAGQTVDFSGTVLSLALTPTFGGDPIAVASSEDGSLTFVPGAVPYFAIDLRVADRTWRVSRTTTIFGDILRYPDPANSDHVEWLGRLALRVNPGSNSTGIATPATSPVLIPAQPYEGRLVATPVIVGPQGVPGERGADSTIQETAVTSLGGHRVVRGSLGGLRLASAGSLSDAGSAIGITTGAAEAGQPATFQPSGIMTESSWAWTPGPIFLGSNGALTQSPPAAAFEQQVAIAISATRIVVQIEPPILLASQGS
jgi:hypothetical protein